MDELEEIRAKKMKELIDMVERGKAPKEFPSSPIELTDSNFEEKIREHQLLLIDFWAPWCAPCRVVSPIVEELAKEYKGRVVFGKLNTDENPATARKFGIMSIPTLLIMKNERMVDRIVGAVPKKYIESVLGKYL